MVRHLFVFFSHKPVCVDTPFGQVSCGKNKIDSFSLRGIFGSVSVINIYKAEIEQHLHDRVVDLSFSRLGREQAIQVHLTDDALRVTVTFRIVVEPQQVVELASRGLGLAFGAGAGFAAGFAWVAASFGVNYLFEAKSCKLFLVNGGYHTVQFTVMGAILGVWP